MSCNNTTKCTNAYAQMDKNTVDSRKQLEENDYVKFDNVDGCGVRVMFVGNSITLHGRKLDIGWDRVWGMAASSKDKDYVHVLESKVLSADPDAAFCICQNSGWEIIYNNEAERAFPTYTHAREFDADIIVFRSIENCPGKNFDNAVFKCELKKLLQYLDGKSRAKIIITTAFWHHPGDDALREYAKENGLPLIELGDLGEDDSMKALGLFEHAGVANHPGDLGMKAIADRIGELLVPMVKELKAGK